MDFIIFDLEATCWDKSTPGVTQEIIEIGALRLNQLGEINGTFHSMVRPVVHSILSPYCKKLTNIGQDEVNKARTFPDVISRFEDWLYVSPEFFLISWGSVDKTMLENDCRANRLDHDWLDFHVNLKQVYRDLFRLPKQLGLKAAMRREGIEFEGQAHRAMDDAKNLVELFLKHRDQWPLEG